MMKIDVMYYARCLSCIILIWICAGCRSATPSPYHSEYRDESKMLKGAVAAVIKLQEQGNLPGFGANDYGHLETLPLDREGVALAYPQMVIVRIQSEENHEYALYYKLMKKSNRSNWVLVEAWKQDGTTGEHISVEVAP